MRLLLRCGRVVAALITAAIFLSTLAGLPREISSTANTFGGGLVQIALGLAALIVFCLLVFGPHRVRGVIDDLRGGGQRGRAIVHNNYYGPVTINPDATTAPPVGAPPRPRDDDLPEIRLADYVEYPDDAPAIIQNRTFQNVVLKGPMILYLQQGVSITNCDMGIAGNDLESILWPVEEKTVIGPVVLKNVVMDNCKLRYIGFAGPQDHLDLLRKGTRH